MFNCVYVNMSWINMFKLILDTVRKTPTLLFFTIHNETKTKTDKDRGTINKQHLVVNLAFYQQLQN